MRPLARCLSGIAPHTSGAVQANRRRKKHASDTDPSDEHQPQSDDPDGKRAEKAQAGCDPRRIGTQ